MIDINIIKLSPSLKFSLKDRESIGILDKGKNNTIKGNHIIGYNIVIQEEGEDSRIEDNKIE